MDDETHTTPREFPAQPNPGIGGGTYHAGTINTSAGNIIMLGCATTSNFTSTSVPAVPSDFWMTPLGDIDLQHEICVDNRSGVVWRQSERRSVRRLYSARVKGRNSSVTVAVYHGDGGEEEWREDIAKYMLFRHPNIIQVCGAASSGGVHTTLFHDDLIPFHHFLHLHRHSPILTAYIHASSHMDFEVASNYTYSAVKERLHSADCTFWIRGSTGRLCAELTQSSQPFEFPFSYGPDTQGLISWSPPNTEAIAIDSLTLSHYHDICSVYLCQDLHVTASPRTTVDLGTVMDCSSTTEIQDSIKIAYLPNLKADRDLRWWVDEQMGEVVDDGWTRFNSSEISNLTVQLRASTFEALSEMSWLSQANHIFKRLSITSNFEDYVLVRWVLFVLNISVTTDDPPAGFLFLCPEKHFQIGPSSFSWPDCPAYWSFDPSGTKRLSMDEATRLGFPSIEREAIISRWSWDASVYAGLRQFHMAKGFNPESQDVTRHLGYLLFELSHERDIIFAHVDETDSGAAENFNLRGSEKTLTAHASQSSQTAASEEPTTPPAHEDMLAPSRTFKSLMSIQLALMFFLTVSLLYDQS